MRLRKQVLPPIVEPGRPQAVLVRSGYSAHRTRGDPHGFKALATLAAAGVLLVQTGCAWNSTPPASAPTARSDLGFVPNRMSAGTFRSFDDDNDGFLSRNEARGSLSTYFDQLDRDGDGKLSPAELGVSPQAIGQY
jgi:hypothetical protein